MYCIITYNNKYKSKTNSVVIFPKIYTYLKSSQQSLIKQEICNISRICCLLAVWLYLDFQRKSMLLASIVDVLSIN